MDYHLIQGVFPPLTQCLRDRLWIHHSNDQNKAATEDEYIKLMYRTVMRTDVEGEDVNVQLAKVCRKRERPSSSVTDHSK